MTSPRASLVLTYEGQVIDEIAVRGARVTLGRAPDNTVRFDDLAVSAHHAEIIMQPGNEPGPVIVDLGSTNGIRVNGTRVQRQRLRSGDLIDLGHYRLRYLEEPALPAGGDSAAHPPRLRVLNGPDVGRESELSARPMTLGGAGTAQAVIERRGAGYVLAPRAGADAPLVNGVAVEPGGRRLERGDVVEVGGVRYEFMSL